ncbi:hypothetical protein B0H11DRAFT_1752138 [Mycena galericulata]|nr:hypothetical protein B0H11DRAFT_1752138 [Mycena galericulata]
MEYALSDLPPANIRRAITTSYGGKTAGAGKTVLSCVPCILAARHNLTPHRSVVVNHLRTQFQNSNTAVACIYLNHKETDVQTPVNLFASIWKQLVVDKCLPPAVHDLYKHNRTRDTRPSLAELFDILKSAVAQHSRFVPWWTRYVGRSSG